MYGGKNTVPLLETKRPGTSRGTRLSLEEDVGKQYSIGTLTRNAEKNHLWFAPFQVKPQKVLDLEL